MQARVPGPGAPPARDDLFFDWIRARVQRVRAPESLRARIEAMLAVERALPQ